MDTGGLGLLRGEKATDVIAKAALEQVQIAIDSANVIILVVNAREGVVPLDHEVAERLHESGKPVLVAANKVDTSSVEASAAEFATHDLIITSYGTLARDQMLFTAVEFACVIADEAQHIKNRRSQNAAALRALRARTACVPASCSRRGTGCRRSRT